MASSYTFKILRKSDDSYLIPVNGKVGAMRKFPFSTNTFLLSAIDGYDGSYQVASLTSSGVYKLFSGDTLNTLTEDKGWGGDNGIRINVDDNNFTFDEINSVYLTIPSHNVLIGATGSDVNKLAVYGNTSVSGSSKITGNLSVGGTISAGALYFVSTTANVAEISLTSQSVDILGSVSITGDGIPPIEDYLFKVHQPNIAPAVFSVNNSGETFIKNLYNQDGIYSEGDITGNNITASNNITTYNNISASAYKLNTQAQDYPFISNDGIATIIDGSVYDDTPLFIYGFGRNSSILLYDSEINFEGNLNAVNSNLSVKNIYSSNLSSLTASLSGGAYLSKNGSNVYLSSTTDKFGIGTITPTEKFSVSGNISNTGNLICSTASNIGLFVLSSGRIGINTSTPTVALEVSGSQIGGMSYSLGKGGNMTLGYAFNRNFTNGAIFDSTRYAFQFTRPGNADRLDTEVYNSGGTLVTSRALTIDGASGYLGFGTNSPATRVHIVGDETVSGGRIYSQINGSVTGNIAQSTQAVTYQKGANYVIAFNDAGTMKYRYMVLTGTDANWTYSTIAP